MSTFTGPLSTINWGGSAGICQPWLFWQTSEVFSDLMEEGRYDAILLDVQMPNMDGLETVRRIRARERDTEGEMQQVFMVTAFADVETREMAQAAGANGFLAKPFAPDELFDVLRSIHMARGESQ